MGFLFSIDYLGAHQAVDGMCRVEADKQVDDSSQDTISACKVKQECPPPRPSAGIELKLVA